MKKLKSPSNKQCFDKIILKFFSDVLYIKGILCYEEYEDIMNCCDMKDLDDIFEKMLNEEYNGYKRGELPWRGQII